VISGFFIDRPIFASVISIVITLAGAIAMTALPIAQYPPIAPPTVVVSCSFPGASSQVVADTIAAPIEQQVNGVEGMLYMSSQSGNDGSYNLTITFDLGTNLNTALVMVQNRVALALPQLPDSVQRQGLTIKKKSADILLVVNFFSPDGRYDDLYLSNFATINVKDEILRLEGVGDLNVFGQRDYSIRAWLDPQQLASRNMTANDVARAIQSQSAATSPGQVGRQPADQAAEFQLPIDMLGRLQTPEQFGEVIVKAEPTRMGSSVPLVRLRDVARVELGAQNYNLFCRIDGQPSAGLAIYQLPGSNALDAAERVRAKMKELAPRFPEGLEYGIYLDATLYIRASIEDVVKTLLEAIGLVALVVLVFLQSWRATLIPLVAVPVAIVGTFSVMAVIGFSFNNISLFGLVLAIGIVVDDAIVVVENVERWLEEGHPPREAAHRAMEEVTGPVIAVALVLCAVFLPCAFISGITGQFFRQFAVTIAVSTVLSALNSLTLSPALAAILLRPRHAKPDLAARLLQFTLGWFFRLFNAAFHWGTEWYARLIGWLLRMSLIVGIVYAGLLFLTGRLLESYPVGFIPQQDQGRMFIDVRLPDAASVQRTRDVMEQVEKIAHTIPGVAHTMVIAGQSVLMQSNASNYGTMFVILEPWSDRDAPELTANGIIDQLRQAYAAQIKEAIIGVYGMPPVPGIGLASGFKLMVENPGAAGYDDLQQATENIMRAGNQVPNLLVMPPVFRANSPQLYLDVDRAKAEAIGVSVNDVNQTLQIYLGSYYVNNFNAFGRYWQVNVQAEGSFRDQVSDLNQLFIRSKQGNMVPLGTLVRMRNIGGPAMITRYNLYTAAAVMGGAMPPMSSGQAIDAVDRLAGETLPASMKTEWTELTLMQIKAGNTALYIFGAAVVMVFLVLAAQYESWTLPLAVILVVPMCLLSSLTGVLIRRLPMDIFVQIGFVVLVGLACKNAILIVEFAKQLVAEGKPRGEATIEASRLRLRPILMTSFAFILGVLPMVVAHGAGAEMRWSLGTAVFSGMIGVTFFGIFLTPVFFNVIEWCGEFAIFRSVWVTKLGSFVVGGIAGLIIGWLAFKAGIPSLRWSLVGGVILGLVSAGLVQSGFYVRKRRRVPHAGEKSLPDKENPPSTPGDAGS
jgi:hydrophobe/amphiphile efflux-1 (HAE1) family protein